MKILLVAPTYLPARRANTIQVMKMAQAIKGLGHNVRVLVPNPGVENPSNWDSLAHHYGLHQKFKVEWLDVNPGSRSYDYGLKAVRYFRQWDSDILYTRLPQAAALASWLNIPTIFEIHDLPGGKLGPWLFRRFIRGKGARKLVVITQSLRDAISQLTSQVPKPPSTVIAPDGVDIFRYERIPDPITARETLRKDYFPTLATSRFTVGYTGHLYPGRGVELILAIASRLPKLNFLIVGGDPNSVSAVLNQVDQQRINNMIVTGYVPNADLPIYQAACDVLLMPYQYSVSASSGGDIAPFLSPLKLFEYLACGRVIMSSDLPVLLEVLNEKNSIINPPDDVDTWVRSILDIERDPARQAAIAEQAKADSRNYTWTAQQRGYFPPMKNNQGNLIRKRLIIVFMVNVALSLGLAAVSTGFSSLQRWGSFFGVIILSSGIIYGIWYALRKESLPGWLGWLLIGAVLLRIGVGILWYVALPHWGHATDGEMAGYVMSDAHRRDSTAWDLAKADKSLFAAFQDYRFADQYGGLLFFSAAVYRFLGSNSHQPLIIVVLAASFSGLSILFVWVFTRRLWGENAANLSAGILAIYPEAVLLGSSQMREAFTMTLAGMALYGLLKYWQDRKMVGIVWVVGSLLISAPISTLFAISLSGILIALVFVLDRARILKNWVLWAVLGGFLVVGIIGIWLMGERLYPEGASNPWELISQWLVFAARWEQRTAAISSGWMAKIFRRSPEWMNIWLILGYGTVQPFLPASLIATGNWIWRLIAIWRSLGWTVLLVLLLYAPIRVGQKIRNNFITAGVLFIVWFGIILSAYRGGGDQWDNPRYRVTFIVLQVAVAGWVLAVQRRDPDPWLGRILGGMGWVFAWFIPWYLRRYSPITWPVIDLFKTLGLGFSSAVLYWVWDWVRSKDISSLDSSGEQ